MSRDYYPPAERSGLPVGDIASRGPQVFGSRGEEEAIDRMKRCKAWASVMSVLRKGSSQRDTEVRTRPTRSNAKSANGPKVKVIQSHVYVDRPRWRAMSCAAGIQAIANSWKIGHVGMCKS
jgi:hypothetical protein